MPYARDLRRIRAKYDGRCCECGESFDANEQILWDPEDLDTYHVDCDPRAMAPTGGSGQDLDAAVVDVPTGAGTSTVTEDAEAAIADGVARELQRPPERRRVPDLTAESFEADRHEEKARRLGDYLAHEVGESLRSGDPLNIGAVKGALRREGVDYVLGVGPVSTAAVFGAEAAETAADLAGWSEEAVRALVQEGREIVLELESSPEVDRLGDILENLGRRASDEN